ncbi:MFS transporter [Sphaerobacter thermophilus]|jgi:DHA1 family multidrug resistance protein-like MFS transporter|uniref:Major facilitator superfamily MFS_1 n=1 Tax=Sphaerobacter thermophilus (strain ATCC 49802 / DSM 20745 / KCCM 41009 / NCIMB 13125 / S 6022) TaxID=479434 RepID=D1C9N2_SPHTD|nr:MFS transporter [Sphaerobacter thermophilus]ACZ40525.1 major facilitator superfamily MFS_1 [Sphaerobacter thermophilus DSM 20745]PZN63261.1 MAG: MFS transporter [Sphaerobacter thermophilus]
MTSWQRTLYALWLAQTLTIIGFSLRTPFLPLFLGDLGAESMEQQALWSGLINGGGAAIMAVTAPLWGFVADRYGRKPMVLRAMFVGSCTIGLMALATSPWHLLALRFVEGGLTGTVTASTALVATTVPKERLGYSLGLMQMAIFSGSSVGPLLGGVLGDTIGYRPTFVLAGSLLFISGVLVLVLVQENFERPVPRDEDASERVSMRALLVAPAMLAMILVLFGLRAASSAIQPIMPLYVEQLANRASGVASLAGITMGVMGLTSALASVLLGRAGDRFGTRPILLVSIVLSGLLYLPQAGVQSVGQLILLQAVFGLAVGGALPTANAIVAHLTPPERRGAIYGFTAAATSLGGFVGPLGGASLAAAISIRATFLVMGALLLVIGLWAWRAIPERIGVPATPGSSRTLNRSGSLR